MHLTSGAARVGYSLLNHFLKKFAGDQRSSLSTGQFSSAAVIESQTNPRKFYQIDQNKDTL